MTISTIIILLGIDPQGRYFVLHYIILYSSVVLLRCSFNVNNNISCVFVLLAIGHVL